MAVDNVPGAVRIEHTELPRRCVWCSVRKARGFQAASAGADVIVSIAQFGSTRSINVAVAAGIVMHSWIRQWADTSRAW